MHSILRINEFLDSYFDVYVKTEFPVVEEDGYLIGTVMAKDATNVQESKRDKIKVEEIMITKDELILMKSNAFADEALKRLIRDNKSRIFVYEDRESEKMIPIGRLDTTRSK
jgi:Mg2+/Co2+ transporter CorC